VEIVATHLRDCFEIKPRVFEDARGRFVKLFNREVFAAHGLPTDFAEWCYSASAPRVLRGLHFQTPPFDQAKLVFCLKGRVIDVVVDLRRGSPSYGQHGLFELDAGRATGLLVPRGFAHGFYVPDEYSLFAYQIETVFSAPHDSGIRWDSAGVPWPDAEPLLSDRDKKLVALKDFISPFVYQASPK